PDAFGAKSRNSTRREWEIVSRSRFQSSQRRGSAIYVLCFTRADFTASTNALALLEMAPQSLLAIASLETSADPAPTKTAPARIQSGVVLMSTPPVGVSFS